MNSTWRLDSFKDSEKLLLPPKVTFLESERDKIRQKALEEAEKILSTYTPANTHKAENSV